MSGYDTGDLVRIGNHTGNIGRAPFTLLDGTATDPTAVRLTVRQPDGTELVYGWPIAGSSGTLTREVVARFYAEVALSQSGDWFWRLAGTGAVQAAAEGWFYVEPTVV